MRNLKINHMAVWIGMFAISVMAMAGPAASQDLPENAGPERTVKLFDLFCFGLLPDLETIAQIADEHFDAITGDELQRYQPSVPAEELHAWKFVDFEQEYVLTTARSAPDDQFRADNPEFAEATSYACSLLLPAQDPQDDIRAHMASLMEREPDENWADGPLKANEWSGQTEQMMVNVMHYGPANGSPGGLLSSVAFVLP